MANLWESSLGEDTIETNVRITIFRGLTGFIGGIQNLHQETSLTTSTVTNDNELPTDLSHFSVDTKNESISIQLSRQCLNESERRR